MKQYQAIVTSVSEEVQCVCLVNISDRVYSEAAFNNLVNNCKETGQVEEK